MAIENRPNKPPAAVAIRHKSKVFQVECTPDTTVKAIKESLYTLCEIAPARQRFTILSKLHSRPIVLDDDQPVGKYEIDPEVIIDVKDLGPQVGWRTVFLLEYAGPLIIHQLFVCWIGTSELSTAKFAAWAMISLHYMKRLYETIFVHRFSHATMPLSGCVRNCVHYWVIGGLWVGRSVYRGDVGSLSVGKLALLLMFMASEAGNYYAHHQLRQLRPPGTKRRGIPRGFLFKYVSCPNYTFEVLAWLSYAAFVNKPIAWFFAFAGAAQMWQWARKKHSAYLREFPGYPKDRTPILPFLPV